MELLVERCKCGQQAANDDQSKPYTTEVREYGVVDGDGRRVEPPAYQILHRTGVAAPPGEDCIAVPAVGKGDDLKIGQARSAPEPALLFKRLQTALEPLFRTSLGINAALAYQNSPVCRSYRSDCPLGIPVREKLLDHDRIAVCQRFCGINQGKPAFPDFSLNDVLALIRHSDDTPCLERNSNSHKSFLLSGSGSEYLLGIGAGTERTLFTESFSLQMQSRSPHTPLLANAPVPPPQCSSE